MIVEDRRSAGSVNLNVFSVFSLLTRSDPATAFGVDEYLALKDISEIAVSPDGDYVAYTLTSKDIDRTCDAIDNVMSKATS